MIDCSLLDVCFIIKHCLIVTYPDLFRPPTGYVPTYVANTTTSRSPSCSTTPSWSPSYSTISRSTSWPTSRFQWPTTSYYAFGTTDVKSYWPSTPSWKSYWIIWRSTWYHDLYKYGSCSTFRTIWTSGTSPR